MHRDHFGVITRIFGLRITATALVLLGLLSGLFGAVTAGAQTLAVIELRVHSCPDDFDGTGFFQHQTQCTSEQSLYGVGMGVQSVGDEAAVFQYSQPDDTGRAELMRWDAVLPGPVTITEVAPDPIKPSVAFCSLQPTGSGPVTMDGEQVPVDNGVMTITLTEGDILMCDWYRFPGGITGGNGDDGGTGDNQGADRDGDGLLDDDEEQFYGTDPDNADTDGDGTSDGDEVYFGTDPLVADEPTTRTDTDEDGLYDDDEEQLYNTDPNNPDTDGDGVSDGEEVFLNTDPTVADGGNGGGDNGGNPEANCLDPEEATFLTMLNDLRAQTGAPPVQVSGTLNEAAEAHSQDMVTRNFFDHVNPDGQDVRDRILAAGYVEGSASRFAENIDRPRETGREVFDYWEGGADEYRTMVDPELVAIGIARVEVPNSDLGWYWTTTYANEFDVAPDC
jgi:uncharacterized protein YkwD